MGNLSEEEFEKLKQQEATRNAIHHDIGAIAIQTKNCIKHMTILKKMLKILEKS